MERLEAQMCKRSLHAFVKRTWNIVEPKQAFVDNWHIRELCEVLEAVTRGDFERVIINISPGSMKSLLVSVFWPAWEWATNPELRYLTASYGSHLTIRDNLRLRSIINSPWYQKHFELKLKGDQNAKERFDTTAGGWRIATSVGGVGTGEHPDRVIIDDPVTAQDAKSDVERGKVNDWFDGTMSSRGLSRSVRVVVVMQRLHEDDLTGHLLSKAGWEHVCFPMRYTTKHINNPNFRPDPRDPRTTEGELMWPEVFPEKKVRQLELDLNAYGASGQLQQQPSPEGGGLFQRGWFKIVDALPREKGMRQCRGWDTAASEDTGDWTCGVRLAETQDGRVFITHMVRAQVSPAGVDALMLQTANADGIQVKQREEKEPGASGVAVINARAKLLRGKDYKHVQVSVDKVTRANPFRAQCEAGNVHMVRGDWNETYLSQVTTFPTGKNDDVVDGSSCAYNSIVAEPRIGSAVWGR